MCIDLISKYFSFWVWTFCPILPFFPRPSPNFFCHFLFLPKSHNFCCCLSTVFQTASTFPLRFPILGKFFPNTFCLCFCAVVSCIYFASFACFLTFSLSKTKKSISCVPDFCQFTMKIHDKNCSVQNNFSHQKPIRYFSGLTECCPLCISNPKSSVLKKVCKAKKKIAHPCNVCDASDAR